MSFYQSPTFNLDTNEWTKTPFEKRKDALFFVKKHTKYPGEYNLKYTQGTWNEQACFFQEQEKKTGNGHYPKYVKNSADFRNHWDFEEEKCLFEGFIIYKKPSENLEYVVPCLYYWYLNYIQIPDKVKQKDDFPEIYDGDLHYYLYILECILVREFGVVLKKRQSGYTLKNMSIKLNAIWFGRGAMSKIFAFDENKVKESWSFMTRYRDFNNQHCAWKRAFDPKKELDWNMRRKLKDGSYKGRNCQAKGFTTKQDPTNGIGGSAKVIFGEESGANPTLDKTHEFITSNVSYGGLTTGLIIYSGAVGELDKAEPLKEFILRPKESGFVSRPNNIPDDIEFGPEVGFFAPEWWNYVSVERDEDDKPVGEALRCFDEWGNSDKDLALSEIGKWRKLAEKRSPEKYRYYCSQRPLSIKEAFAFRKDSIWPTNLVEAQKRRIDEKQYPCELVDIEPDEHGQLQFIKSIKSPIRDFPITKTEVDKEGIIEIWERPIGNPKFGMYYASVDPVREGKTTTSTSLFSIYIYKRDTEVTRIENGETETFIEPGKIVACWHGRFDDPNKTHERAQHLIEMYNAWTLSEANASEFINHMINKKRQHYLVPKSQIAFLKDLNANMSSFQEYGWKNTGTMFKNNMIPYGIKFLKEEIDSETLDNGNIIRRFGVERIPDIMLFKEIDAYHPDLNVDRLISFCALASFVSVQNANQGYIKRVDYLDPKEKVISDKKLYTKPSSFFSKSNIKSSDNQYSVKKGLFRNLK